jgi:hypothetical protein
MLKSLRWFGLVCLVLVLVAGLTYAQGTGRPGAEMKPLVLAVTTNTTSPAIAIPFGYKSIYGQVVGIGAVTQTQAIYGDIDDDAANGILLCTLTLSGTTRTQDACPPFTANFIYFYVVTTNTTGTAAIGAVYAMY